MINRKELAIALLLVMAPNIAQAFGAFATLCEPPDGASVVNYILGSDRGAFLSSLEAPTYPDVSLSDLTLADSEARQKLVMSNFTSMRQRESAIGFVYDGSRLRMSPDYERVVASMVREGVAAERLPFGGEECACNLYYHDNTSVHDTLMEDAQ